MNGAQKPAEGSSAASAPPIFEESLIETRGVRAQKSRWIMVSISFALHVTVLTVLITATYWFIGEAIQPPAIPVEFFSEPPAPPLPREPLKAAPRIPITPKKKTEEAQKEPQVQKRENTIRLPLFEKEERSASVGQEGERAIPKNTPPAAFSTPDMRGSMESSTGRPQTLPGGQPDYLSKGKGDKPGTLSGKKSQTPGFPVTRKDILGGGTGVTPGSGSGDSVGGRFNFDSGFSPNLSFETKDFDWSDYANAIYMAIWRSWHNRLYMTLSNFERWSLERNSPSINGVAGISFVIERNGNISEINLLYSSSVEPLDVASMDALREAVLPPLPPNFPEDKERVTARFIADTDIKAMKHWLPIYKYYGYF